MFIHICLLNVYKSAENKREEKENHKKADENANKGKTELLCAKVTKKNYSICDKYVLTTRNK